jgi:hypothetical protein
LVLVGADTSSSFRCGISSNIAEEHNCVVHYDMLVTS